jgi:cyclophilin family peptidyl-prolyl cis-trans isomerase
VKPTTTSLALALALGLGLFASASAQAPYLPKGYSLTPYLAAKQVRTFKAVPKYTLKAKTDYMAVIETNKGRIVLDLFEDKTPITVNNFVFLARNRYFDGIVFHRVLKDFMAQTGDPTGTGTGGPGYQFGDEFRQAIKFTKKGDLAMANSGPATNGSQFFITFKNTDYLNGKHTIFGTVTEGMDVLDKIQLIDPGTPDAKIKPDTMTRVYIVEKAK